MKLDEFLSKKDQRRVVDAIAQAEHRTSGQIKVHVEPRVDGNAMARAHLVFDKLGLTATRARNAVLIYVASDDRKLAIIGDEGIHQHVGDDFWQAAAKQMTERFKAGAYADGLVAAITTVGETLRAKFPHEDDGKNELPDEISTPEQL